GLVARIGRGDGGDHFGRRHAKLTRRADVEGTGAAERAVTRGADHEQLATLERLRADRAMHGRSLTRPRQPDHHLRTLPGRGLDVDATAVLGDDRVARRQAEARALFLRGDERVEDAAE